ncbi:hypothetical protein ZIOFF_016054 [Zingiber officinale]|uniref:Uncharacterized protein n=1 Tax=Zingiber officinale TaxID=94328 RepID=A0A8J5HJR9_ZINOF|nr:hypothetical protein ZIOFF_016054 [Zingiber officinale]
MESVAAQYQYGSLEGSSYLNSRSQILNDEAANMQQKAEKSMHLVDRAIGILKMMTIFIIVPNLIVVLAVVVLRPLRLRLSRTFSLINHVGRLNEQEVEVGADISRRNVGLGGYGRDTSELSPPCSSIAAKFATTVAEIFEILMLSASGLLYNWRYRTGRSLPDPNPSLDPLSAAPAASAAGGDAYPRHSVAVAASEMVLSSNPDIFLPIPNSY